MISEPPLIAQMIFACYHNGLRYRHGDHTIYGILMKGTEPTFYRLTMNDSVARDILDEKPIQPKSYVVYRYRISKQGNPAFITTGLPNVTKMVACFEALRIWLTTYDGSLT